MVVMMRYITLQVIVLFSFNLLFADDTPQKGVQHDTNIHIVSGPGKILDISKKVVLGNAEDKNIDDLLYEIYKKFYKDVKRQSSGNVRNPNKKGMIIETDGVNFPQKKTVDDSTTTTSGGVHKEHEDVQKEEHKIALRELESTIDNLIDSLTKVTKDGKYEEKKINKGIEDMSKFADLSHINIHTTDDVVVDDDAINKKKKNEIESFGNFKERFYDTFSHNNIVKKQKIVYHGKKDAIITTPSIVYHGKDSIATKQYRDNNAIKTSKWKHLKQQRSFDIPNIKSTSNRAQHRDVVANSRVNILNGKRMKELADLYDELKRQTAAETKRTSIRQPFQYVKRKDHEDDKEVKIGKLKNDLVSLFDVMSSNDGSKAANTKDLSPRTYNVVDRKRTKVFHSFKQVKRNKEVEGRDMKIERLKKDLMSLFDVITNDGGGGNTKDSLHYRNKDGESNLSANKIPIVDATEQNQLKKELLQVMCPGGGGAGAGAGAGAGEKITENEKDVPKARFKKQLLSVVCQSEKNIENEKDVPNEQFKRQLLSVVCQSETNNENEKDVSKTRFKKELLQALCKSEKEKVVPNEQFKKQLLSVVCQSETNTENENENGGGGGGEKTTENEKDVPNAQFKRQLLRTLCPKDSEVERKDTVVVSKMKIHSKEAVSNKINDRFESDLDSIVTGKTQTQNEMKKRLLSVVRSLEAELTEPITDVQSEKVINKKHVSDNKLNDRFENDLDHIVSETKESNTNNEIDEFIDALKGFVEQPGESVKTNGQ